MVPALPPAPPALVMFLDESETLLSVINLDILFGSDITAVSKGIVEYTPRRLPGKRTWSAGFKLGPKTLGARDRSQRSRSRRRKP